MNAKKTARAVIFRALPAVTLDDLKGEVMERITTNNAWAKEFQK